MGPTRYVRQAGLSTLEIELAAINQHQELLPHVNTIALLVTYRLIIWVIGETKRQCHHQSATKQEVRLIPISQPRLVQFSFFRNDVS